MKPSTSARIAIKGSAFLSDARLLYGFKIALTLAFVIWLWDYLRTQNLAVVWRALHASWLALAVALIPVNVILQFWKWHLLLRCAQPDCSARVSLYSLFAGFPLGLLTPGRWGELARALYVPQIAKEKVFAMSAWDKIHTLLVNALLGSLALIYLAHKNFLPEAWQWPAWLSAGVFLPLNVALLLPAQFVRWLSLPGKIGLKKFATFPNVWQVSARKLSAIYVLSLLFVVTYCFQMVAFICAFNALDALPAFACAAAIFFLKSALPITIGELGVREGMAVFFFAALHVPAVAALHASLMLFLLNLVAPALAGLLWIWKRKNEEQTCF